MIHKVPTKVLLRLDGPDKTAFKIPDYAVFTLGFAIFVICRIRHLTRFSLWTDEIFSLKAARSGWSAMFGTIVLDKVHPPLFYIILKFWIAIGGQSLWWVKLLPVLIAIATVIPLCLLCKEINLPVQAMNVVLILMAVNTYLIQYAQELRMYSLLFLFTVSSFWLFARFINRDESVLMNLLFLFINNLLLVYTHYFGWLVVGVEVCFLIWCNRRKFLLFSASVVSLALCFSPWVYLIVRAIWLKQGSISGLDWIKPPHLSSLVAYFASLSGPLDFSGSTYVRMLLFGGPVLLWLWQLLRQDQTRGPSDKPVFLWLFTFLVVPLAFIYAVSTLSPKSIWNQRQLMITVAPFMLLVVIALEKLHPRWLKTSLLILVVTWSAAAGFRQVIQDDELTRIPLQSMVLQMTRAEPSNAEGIKVYQFERNLSRPIKFYLDESHESRFQPILVDDVRAVEGNHFWIAFRETRESEKGFPPLQVLNDEGYRVGEGIVTGDVGRRVYLLPVWKQTIGGTSQR